MASGTYLSGVGTTDLPIYSSGVSDVLLDSIRDATFLGSGSNDFGLGVTDDPKFFFAGYVDPSTKTARQYPVKFFWLGSPAGTNDKDDVFSIFMADVVPGAFQFGALPSAWLVNPRLVLSEAQAKSDVVAWFDANYPGGGGTAGVGASNTGSSPAYGNLAGGTSAVGNVSGMSSIDGEYWPILDLVDGSLLLYFSVKTPNCNTLSIYCYRLASPEVPTPAATSDFVGGLSGSGWFGPNRPMGTPIPANPTSVGVLSSHRFSLLSPDPLVSAPRVAGTQNAVMAYSFGAFDGVTPDHGAFINASVVADIHANPLNPGSALAFAAGEIDNGKQYPVDKLGTISQAPMVDRYSAGYAVIYNAPSDRDLRAGSNGVVISSMQLRVMYVNLATGTVGYGSSPLRYASSLPNVGFCRPQFTHLPDGIPKLLYANFTFDQYLNLGYEYVPPDLLSPDRQKSIIQTGNPSLCYAYGKRRARLRAIPHKEQVPPIGPNPSPENLVSALQVVEYAAYNVSARGFQEGVQPTLLHISQDSPWTFSGRSESTTSLELHLEDLPPFFGLEPVGHGNRILLENVQIEFFD